MNLLSPWTWAIHMATVCEWALAMVLLWNLGAHLHRWDVKRVALAMFPHLGAALSVVTWHFFNDDPDMRLTRFLHEFLTFAGSLTLLAATASLLGIRHHLPKLAVVCSGVAGVLIVGIPIAYVLIPGKNIQSGMIQVAGMTYVGFVGLLALNRRWDREAFSALAVFGFGFLLVFVAVSIAATLVAHRVYHAPSMAHVDWLHGLAESFMTFTNGMLVIAFRRQTLQARKKDQVDRGTDITTPKPARLNQQFP